MTKASRDASVPVEAKHTAPCMKHAPLPVHTSTMHASALREHASVRTVSPQAFLCVPRPPCAPPSHSPRVFSMPPQCPAMDAAAPCEGDRILLLRERWLRLRLSGRRMSKCERHDWPLEVLGWGTRDQSMHGPGGGVPGGARHRVDASTLPYTRTFFTDVVQLRLLPTPVPYKRLPGMTTWARFVAPPRPLLLRLRVRGGARGAARPVKAFQWRPPLRRKRAASAAGCRASTASNAALVPGAPLHCTSALALQPFFRETLGQPASPSCSSSCSSCSCHRVGFCACCPCAPWQASSNWLDPPGCLAPAMVMGIASSCAAAAPSCTSWLCALLLFNGKDFVVHPFLGTTRLSWDPDYARPCSTPTRTPSRPRSWRPCCAGAGSPCAGLRGTTGRSSSSSSRWLIWRERWCFPSLAPTGAEETRAGSPAQVQRVVAGARACLRRPLSPPSDPRSILRPRLRHAGVRHVGSDARLR